MLSTIQSILQHNCQLVINKPVVIGVSGGPDSLALLDMLWRLGYPVIVAHLNHNLRAEADGEAIQVQEEANKRKLPFVTQKLDIRAYAEAGQLSVEEAARTVRYTFLFQQARLFGAQAVAVGHNADDQVETILMHLLRGTGSAGLAGMQYTTIIEEFDQEIPLVRPLLGTWREQINAYISERSLAPIVDKSNWDREYLRNRLRHDLLPELESYNPRIRQAIYRMADILRADLEIIETATKAAWENCLLEQGEAYIVLSASRLRLQAVGVQRHLVRRGIDMLRPGMRDFDYEAIERGLALLHATGSSRCDLAMGLNAEIDADQFIITGSYFDLPRDRWPQVLESQELVLEKNGEVHLLAGWVLRYGSAADPEEAFALASSNQDLFRAWMDADKLVLPVIVRGRHPGDRICPQGMDGHSMKVSDIMINEKMPSRARDSWPLIVSGGYVVWIPGYRLGHQVQLQEGTRHIAILELTQTRLG